MGFPTPCYRVRTLFVAESKAFVTCFLLGVKTGLHSQKILFGGIPVSVITLMALLFIGCCFMAHFDLVYRFEIRRESSA